LTEDDAKAGVPRINQSINGKTLRISTESVDILPRWFAPALYVRYRTGLLKN